VHCFPPSLQLDFGQNHSGAQKPVFSSQIARFCAYNCLFQANIAH
jgi:hypothetical protein